MKMNLIKLWELRCFWDEIFTVIAYLIAAASVIVKLTPTLKDDNVLLPIIKFIAKYGSLSRKTKDDILRKKKK
jgi:hypothetical protein